MKRQSFSRVRGLQVLSLFLFAITMHLSLFGQAGTSSIRGTVTDPQGKVVAGANVTLTSSGTGTARTATTTDNGIFAFEFVPAGDYQVTVEATGLRRARSRRYMPWFQSRHRLTFNSKSEPYLKPSLFPRAPRKLLINRDDGSLGNNIVGQQIRQLPVNGRNIVPLLSLQPGVTSDGYVAGARSDQSNITLDGIDINESQTNSIGVAQDNPTTAQLPTNNTVIRLNSEAIEEFRVTTVNANANQGGSSGAQISLVTKAGTNSWHGSAFEFYRSKGLAANDFFNNRSGVEKPQLIRHDFSGAVGGPIIQDSSSSFTHTKAGDNLARLPVVRVVPLAASVAENLSMQTHPAVSQP